jgi:GT2 family glycosyltransferase
MMKKMNMDGMMSPAKPKPSESIDVSVVIVNWNTREMLRDCLTSLYNNKSGVTAEIFVVDNASSDGSPDMVAECFPDALLIRNEVNAGFAAANNIAIRRARGRHVLLLNSDTLVHNRVIVNSVAYLDENPDVGAMGCRVLNTDGTVQLTCSAWPSLANLILLTSGLWKLPFLRFLHGYRFDSWKRDTQRDVDVISGCYMLVRSEVIRRVGRLDESFFFFGEETDWCRRIANDGWKLRFAPVGEITHLGGGSSGNLNHRRDLMLSEATVRLHYKHSGFLAASLAFSILFTFNASRLAFWQLASRLMRNPKGALRRQHFAGVVSGFARAWPKAGRA